MQKYKTKTGHKFSKQAKETIAKHLILIKFSMKKI